MIAEAIMHRMGWGDAWYAHPGPGLWPLWWGATSIHHYACDRLVWHAPGRWMVGVWTGPQRDLLCLKVCETNAEANKYLSPGAPTFTMACLAALCKAWLLGIGGHAA